MKKIEIIALSNSTKITELQNTGVDIVAREQINNLADESTMPHIFKDLKTNKTYRYGFQISAGGNPQLISEEVI